MNPTWVLVVIILAIFFFVIIRRHSEAYVYTGVYEGGDGEHMGYDYKQMTHLPWCNRPLSVLSPCNGLRRYYPGQRFPTGIYPISCPPGKVSIYETGNAENPNTISTWKLGREINPVYR